MKSAGPVEPIAKSVVELKINPVGTPGCPTVPDGIATFSGCFAPSCAYSVDVPVPLFATQRMPVDPNAIPHGFTSAGSIVSAPNEVVSETRFVCRNVDWVTGMTTLGFTLSPHAARAANAATAPSDVLNRATERCMTPPNWTT